MSITQQSSLIKEINQHIKIIRFGFIHSQQDPWGKITGLFKLGKKIAIEDVIKQKGFEDGGKYT